MTAVLLSISDEFDTSAINTSMSKEKPEVKIPQREIKFLETNFPHVIEKIVLFWGYPECREYIDSLFIDTRGGRQGFPPSVIEELHMLSNVHDTICPRPAPKSPWCTVYGTR